jgi:hypothetical protein
MINLGGVGLVAGAGCPGAVAAGRGNELADAPTYLSLSVVRVNGWSPRLV